MDALPHAVAMFQSHEPLTIVYLAVTPAVGPFTVRFAFAEATRVQVTV